MKNSDATPDENVIKNSTCKLQMKIRYTLATNATSSNLQAQTPLQLPNIPTSSAQVILECPAISQHIYPASLGSS